MRNQGLRLFAIVSMLALLFGGQLCMLVECGAKPAGAVAAKSAKAAHACCTKGSAAGGAKHAPAPHECAKPCCMSVATSPVPELARPEFLGASELAVAIAAYEMEPPVVAAWVHESRSPRLRHASPPRLAAGLRAPPC